MPKPTNTYTWDKRVKTEKNWKVWKYSGGQAYLIWRIDADISNYTFYTIKKLQCMARGNMNKAIRSNFLIFFENGHGLFKVDALTSDSLYMYLLFLSSGWDLLNSFHSHALVFIFVQNKVESFWEIIWSHFHILRHFVIISFPSKTWFCNLCWFILVLYPLDTCFSVLKLITKNINITIIIIIIINLFTFQIWGERLNGNSKTLYTCIVCTCIP